MKDGEEMKRLPWLILLLAILLAVPFAAHADTLYAAPGQMSLTEALAACKDGDVIELAEGTYVEPDEVFPLTVTKAVTIRAAEGASPVIESPAFKAAIRVEAGGVTLQGLDIRFLRTGIYAIGSDMTLENCKIILADPAWRTSSCGMWCGGIYRMTVRGCAFTGCGISLAGPPLSERSADLPKLTGLFEVGEDIDYFTTHTIENCTVTGTGQGYFMAAGSGNALLNCTASACENGFNLQKEGHVLMTGCTAEACTVCGVRLDATPTAFFGNTLKDNWTAVMAYGGVSFDISENRFENTGCCALYLRDIGYSRFIGNVFTGSAIKSVEAAGTMGGSLWIGNEPDKAPDMSAASDGFIPIFPITCSE